MRVFTVMAMMSAALLPSAADTTPPTSPGSPAAVQITPFELTLHWRPSTDDTGVTWYLIRRTLPTGGTWTESTPATGTSLTIRHLTPGNAYSFTVIATDAAGNQSAPSAPLDVRTPRYTGGPMCSVAYQPLFSGGGSFYATVAMTNLSPGAWQEWTLGFTLEPSQRINPAWGFRQDGTRWTQTYVWLWSSGAGPLLPGATRSVSFSGSYTGTANPPPTGFTINDHPCG